MTEDLKPCPFCGGKASLATWGEGKRKLFSVFCKKCSAEMGKDYSSEKRAINTWNTRPLPDQPEPITVETFQRMKGYIPYSLYQLIDSINAHFGLEG